MRLLFWRPKHNCTKFLKGLTGYQLSDTIVCNCMRMYQLRLLTFGMDISLRWRPIVVATDNEALAWVRNRTAEADRSAAQEQREQAIRACRGYDPARDGEQ